MFSDEKLEYIHELYFYISPAHEHECVEYEHLYKDCGHDDLSTIFSFFHRKFIEQFRSLNGCIALPTHLKHFRAKESRDLIDTIKKTKELYFKLKDTELSFEIDSYYYEIMDYCLDFLSEKGGSPIPDDMEIIDLIKDKPIFSFINCICVDTPEKRIRLDLHLIGEGSYAKVFKYRDLFYDKLFAIKKHKKT